MNGADGVRRETIERVTIDGNGAVRYLKAVVSSTPKESLAKFVNSSDGSFAVFQVTEIQGLAHAESLADMFAAIVSEMRDYARRLKARG